MGSGDPSGLQNRRELASLALVSSTLTRFRQDWEFLVIGILRLRSGFRQQAPATLTPAKRLKLASLALVSSTLTRFRQNEFLGNARSLLMSGMPDMSRDDDDFRYSRLNPFKTFRSSAVRIA